MTALTAAVTALAAVLLLVVPGAATAWVLGVPWRRALALGPGVTCGIVGVATQVQDRTGGHWTPVSALEAAVVTLAGAAVLRLLCTRPTLTRPTLARPHLTRPTLPTASTLVTGAAAVLAAGTVGAATRWWTAIPQNWDAVFHGAATRFIAETGQAGPRALAAVSQPLNRDFYYPTTYHSLTALLSRLPSQLPGAGVPSALDAMSSAIAAVAVLGVAVLAGTLTRSRTTAAAAAVALALMWPFPFRVLGHGPLLPYALGLAVLPGLWAAAAALKPAALKPTAFRPAVPPAAALGLALVGAWSVHPSVALAAAPPLALWGVLALVRAARTRTARALLATALAFAVPVAALGAFVAWTLDPDAAGGMSDFSWPRTRTIPQSLGALADLAVTPVVSVLLATAALLGLVVALGRRHRAATAPLLFGLVCFAVLFVLASAVDGAWVRVVTGYWWDDANRFHALICLPAAVLAGLGATAVLHRLPRHRLPRHRPSHHRPLTASLAVAATVLAAATATATARALAETGYGDGKAVNAGERRVLDELAARYDGGAVLDDPFDGGAWAYALYGIPVVFPAPLADDPGAQLGPARMDLYTSMSRYGYEPMVARRVAEFDVRWVFVGTGSVGGPGRPPGFVGLERNPHLELVAADERARLYRVLPLPTRDPRAPGVPVPQGIPERVPPTQPPDTDSPVVR